MKLVVKKRKPYFKMSLLPYILNEVLDEYRRPADIYDQHFGLGLLDDDIFRPQRSIGLTPLLKCGYVRPWRNLDKDGSGASRIVSNKNEFKVNLDVQQFKPEELKVKVENGFIVVDGKHEERSDQHGFISRQFTRKYKIPEDVKIDALVSNLSSDGVLSLTAPKITPAQAKGKEIPITLTNTPAVKQKDDKKKPEKMEE